VIGALSSAIVLAGIGIVFGMIAGSFIAVLTLRWPAGRSVGGIGADEARSACDSCGHVLSPLELVPVFSFVFLRGRCRHCGAAIAPRHLWVEIAAAAIGGLSMGLYPGFDGMSGACFGWALLALAVLDVEHFWLPDRLTLPLGAAGLLASAWLSPPFTDRLIGAATGFGILTLIAAVYQASAGRRGMGGGDPKLFAAIGAWLGWMVLPFVLLAAASLGLMLAGLDRWRGREVTRATPLPLGALLAVVAWPLWLAGFLR
jgi:leader peptidase (prepilin peptidase)/N-methyltransferase